MNSHGLKSTIYYPSLILGLFLLGVSLSLIQGQNTIPFVNIVISSNYYLSVLAFITLVIYIIYWCAYQADQEASCKDVDKHTIDKGFVFLTVVNGIAMIGFLSTYFPLHRVLEVLILGIIGFYWGITLDFAISGIFYMRTEEEMKEKWLPKIPLAVLCMWKMAYRLPYKVVIVFLVALNYHFYLFSYHYMWLIAFLLPLCLCLHNKLLYVIAGIFRLKKLKKYLIGRFRLYMPAMEIHDRDWLLFGRQEIPVLHNQPPIVQAAYQGDIESVNALLKNGADPDTQNAIGWTALMFGAADNNINLVNLMLEYGANVNIENVYGRTALCFCARYGFDKIAKILIENKAIVNALNDHTGMPPLFIAIEHGHKSMVRILMENGADYSLTNRDNLSPLEFAQQCKQYDIAKFIRVFIQKNEPSAPVEFIDKLLEKHPGKKKK